jgi:hypothetical protein
MFTDLYHIKHCWRKPWIIDVILAFSITSCIYLTYKTSDAGKGIDYNGFLLNLTTELLGVWLSVRIIERMIRKQERLNEIRRNLLRNLRHPFDIAFRKYPHYNGQDLRYLKRELKWFDMRWEQRQSVFKLNEQNLSRKIISMNYGLVTAIENVLIARDLPLNSMIQLENVVEERMQAVSKVLTQLEDEIEQLTLTFWETDNPDQI